MATRRPELGYVLAALGSAAVVLSLWFPWYTLRIPSTFIIDAEQLSQQFGAFGPLIRQGAELASHLGPIHVNAWQTFKQADVALAIAGVVAGGLSLLAYTGRANGTAAIVITGGVVALVVAAYRTVDPPGPSGLLHADWGAFVAVAGALATVVGGVVTRSGESRSGEGSELGWAAVPQSSGQAPWEQPMSPALDQPASPAFARPIDRPGPRSFPPPGE